MLDVFASRNSQSRVYLRSMLPLVSQDSARTWVHFTTNGTWLGHSAGSFTFDNDTYAAMIDNFRAHKNPIPLTYEHPDYSDGQPKPAAGWIHELEIRADGLWGLCEFTERAAGMIRAGEYRFTSVVVDFDSVDRVSGESIGPQLYEVALTNSPFVDGQHPVTLTRKAGERKLKMDIDIKAALKALGLDESASPEQAAKVLEHAMAAIAAQSGEVEEKAPEEPKAEASVAQSAELSAEAPSASLEAPAPAPGGEGEAAAAMQALMLLQEITGKDAAGALAFLEEKKAEIAAIAGGQAPSGTEATEDFEDKESSSRLSNEQELLSNTVKALSARIEALEAEKAQQVEAAKAEADAARKAEADARVELAIKTGRVPATDKAKWVALANEAPARFEEIIATIVPAVPTGTIGKRALTAPRDFNEDDEIARYELSLKFVEPDPAKRRELALKDIQRRREVAAKRVA